MTALTLILAYLLGSIPCGVLLAKAMGAGDLRKIGSGNIGATNAMRTGNKKLGALTLLGDMLKGTAAVLVAYAFAPQVAVLAALLAIAGHIFPIWLKFKGGKGVATALGAILGLSPVVFLLCIATWIGIFKWKRISSLAALVAFILAPAFAYMLNDMQVALCIFLMSIVIIATHRSNIERLLRGEESGFKKP